VSKAGTLTIRVTQGRNTETIQVVSTGIVGNVLVNTIRSQVTYLSRSPSTDATTYWTAVLARAATQLSS